MASTDPHYVYIAWQGTEALYVGCSYNPPQRLYSHRKTEWIVAATHVDIIGPWDKEKALEYEREAIWTLQPTYNVRGKSDPPHPADLWAAGAWEVTYDELRAAGIYA